ncbi:hypothetical protein BOTBODRAFT_173627 [Botryobasidium botryosum FD-172 SS1]|uniref:Uncharacterized protein n=1 Tax=Botryobasidium botryosum (strain FD-172 SS1) TaxID=930990 RepID=A0A067MMM5_BOTB1|nr:hypothetical protein BOTBODRAFT_173627 [Botryobasidium botryosum FD-172 SS1]
MNPTTLYVDTSECRDTITRSNEPHVFAYSNTPPSAYESESKTPIGRIMGRGRMALGQGIDVASRVANVLFSGGGARSAGLSDMVAAGSRECHFSSASPTPGAAPPLGHSPSFQPTVYTPASGAVERSSTPLILTTSESTPPLSSSPAAVSHTPFSHHEAFFPPPSSPEAPTPSLAPGSPPLLPHYILSRNGQPILSSCASPLQVPSVLTPPSCNISPTTPRPLAGTPSRHDIEPSTSKPSPPPPPPSPSPPPLPPPSPSLPPSPPPSLSPSPAPILFRHLAPSIIPPSPPQLPFQDRGVQTDRRQSDQITSFNSDLRSRPAFGTTPPMPSSGAHAPSAPIGLPAASERKSLKIRGVDAHSHWFESRGPLPLDAPLQSAAHAERGDIYLHWRGDFFQLWLKDTDEPIWKPVSIGAFHPFLLNRRLCVRNDGKPSWIDNKSCTTYKKRPRKHGVDLDGSSAGDAKKRRKGDISDIVPE